MKLEIRQTTPPSLSGKLLWFAGHAARVSHCWSSDYDDGAVIYCGAVMELLLLVFDIGYMVSEVVPLERDGCGVRRRDFGERGLALLGGAIVGIPQLHVHVTAVYWCKR